MKEAAATIARYLFEMIDGNDFSLVMKELCGLCERQMFTSREKGDYHGAAFWSDILNLVTVTNDEISKIIAHSSSRYREKP